MGYFRVILAGLLSFSFLGAVDFDEHIVNEISCKLKKDAYGKCDESDSNKKIYIAAASILAIAVIGCIIYANIDDLDIGPNKNSVDLEDLRTRRGEIYSRIDRLREENLLLRRQLSALEIERKRLWTEYQQI